MNTTNSKPPTYRELAEAFQTAIAYHGDDLRRYWEQIADGWGRLPDASVARRISGELSRGYGVFSVPGNYRVAVIVDMLDELH